MSGPEQVPMSIYGAPPTYDEEEHDLPPPSRSRFSVAIVLALVVLTAVAAGGLAVVGILIAITR